MSAQTAETLRTVSAPATVAQPPEAAKLSRLPFSRKTLVAVALALREAHARSVTDNVRQILRGPIFDLGLRYDGDRLRNIHQRRFRLCRARCRFRLVAITGDHDGIIRIGRLLGLGHPCPADRCDRSKRYRTEQPRRSNSEFHLQLPRSGRGR